MKPANPGTTVPGSLRVLMLLENNPYRRDSRVRSEAVSLTNVGHRVTVICPRGPDTRRMREKVGGVTLLQYRRPPEGSGSLAYVIEYSWSIAMMSVLSLVALMRGGFDVVHAHNPPDMLCLIGGVYKLFGKAFVFDHHDLSPEMYGARFGDDANPRLRSTLTFFERLSFRLADRVVSCNDSYAAIARGRGKVGTERIAVVRNGPDVDHMKPMQSDPALRKGSGFVIGYVGIMGPQDGVDILLRAVHHVVAGRSRADVSCVIVGSGDMLDELRDLSVELGIDDEVEFAGWVRPDELPRYVAAMDLCVDPDPSNDYNDKCTMIKMMEYMAMAKPIVAFDLPEHRISAGDAALYASGNDPADLGDRIVELLDDPERALAMGLRGRRRVEETLAWSHQEQPLIDMYAGLAEARGVDGDRGSS